MEVKKMNKERIFLMVLYSFGVFIVLTLEGLWQGKLIGILMFVGIWYVFDNLFKDVFNEEINGG